MTDRTIEIKIKGDTSDLDRDVDRGAERASKRLERLQVQQAKAQRNASRLASVATATGLGLTGARIYAATRGTAAGGGAARWAMLGARAAIAANPLTAVVGTAITALGIGALLSRRRGRADQKEDQYNNTLVAMLAESTKQSTSLNAIQVNTLAAADPLGRGRSYQRQRLAALGATIPQGAANQALRTMDLQSELAATQLALGANRPSSVIRAFANEVTEARTSINTMRLGMRQWGREMISGTAGFVFGQGFQASRGMMTGGGLHTAGGGRAAAFMSLLRSLSPIRSAMGDRDTFGAPATVAGLSAQQQADQATSQRGLRRVRLMALQQMGPGNLLAPAPTVRAGGESEYAFRVQQQRRGMQNEATIRWQDQVLEVLRQMREQGEVSREQWEQFNVQRNPLNALGGVN